MLGMCKGPEGGDRMSAFAEWKNGLITDAEYASACRQEEAISRYWDEHPDEFNDDDPDESEDYFEDDEINEF